MKNGKEDLSAEQKMSRYIRERCDMCVLRVYEMTVNSRRFRKCMVCVCGKVTNKNTNENPSTKDIKVL